MSYIFVSSLLVTYFIVNKISNPIRRLSRTAETVATGNLNIEKFEVKTSDEVNVLSTAFNKMIDNLRELVAKINTASKEITNVSDITYNNSEQNTAAAVEIGNSVNKMVDGINAEKQKTVGTLENSISMYSISKNIKDESLNIHENTLKSVELANDGQLSMDKFNKQLGIINKSFSEVYKFSEILNNRTQNMGKILEVINDISNQTKLLSINALIESAKAGEKGFGFNVVAKEIKKLSENTRISTSKINEIIKAIQNETLILSEKVSNNLEQLNIGNSISQDVIKYFEKIKGSNKLINKDVSKSSKELENLIDNIGNVNKNMDDISLTIDNNLEFITNISASVQEQTACSQEVSGSAAIMNNLIVDLNELIFKFKV